MMDPPSDDLTEKLARIRREMREVYTTGHGAIVLGFSGGKDSTTLAHLFLEAVHDLRPNQRRVPIHLICTDTLVEIPSMASWVALQLERIEDACRSLGIPLTSHLISPDASETFWTYLLGKGYVPPHKFGRWCTDRIKIRPASAFIERVVAEAGSVVMLLGSRSDESSTRGRSIERHRVNGAMFTPHDVEGASCWKPIEDLTTGDVWHFLLQNRPPWGGTHRELVTMYRQGGGECPLVSNKADKQAPSCGSSRFGCWTCTVVKKDVALEGLVDEFEWAEPLLDYREKLVEAREDPCSRQAFRRNGQEKAGPLTISARRRLLEELLDLREETGLPLISDEEVLAITHQWRTDARTIDRQALERMLPRQQMLDLTRSW